MRRVGLFLAGVALCSTASASIVFSGGTYTQNFDSLSSTTGAGVAWSNDSTITGWSLFHQPAPGTANTTYDVGNGTPTTSTFYSFGSTSASDRALGGLPGNGSDFGNPSAGAVAGWIAVAFLNSTGGDISSLNVIYNGEQWRDNNSAAQSLTLQFGFGTTFGTVATWTSAGALFDFTGPQHANTNAAVDGNVAGRVNGIGGLLTLASTWSNGSTLWLRWQFTRPSSGGPDGLALDDFSFSANATIPEPATWQLLGGALLLGGLLRAKRRR